MIKFTELTKYNGFDKDLHNGVQNSYAWCMSELEDYIYVGTARNLLSAAHSLILQDRIKFPISMSVEDRYLDNSPEIWRYKKDDSLRWEQVYKAPENNGMSGFRFMINHKPILGKRALYAASIGRQAKILKSTNGIFWFEVNTSNVQGNSSRSMVSFNHKLYISTIDEALGGNTPHIYYSPDPEFYDFTAIFPEGAELIQGKNPIGGITNLAVFNNRLYACVSKDSGIEVWKSNSSEPKINDWTLVVDNGFGDLANVSVLAVGVYDDYLYVSGTKKLSTALILPQGFDLIRIDSRDNWELVAGGAAYLPTKTINGRRSRSISGFKSGFNSHFNLYGWQIQEYKDDLFVTTFDHSVNISTLREVLLLNRDYLNETLGENIINLLLIFYSIILYIFEKIDYSYGFDFIGSKDGVYFSKLVTNGLGTPTNYGGRMLFVDSCNDLYLGTANPYLGCEVWRISSNESRAPKHRANSLEMNSLFPILYYLYDVIVRAYYLITTITAESSASVLEISNNFKSSTTLKDNLKVLADNFSSAYATNTMNSLLFELLEEHNIDVSNELFDKDNELEFLSFLANFLKDFVDKNGIEESISKITSNILCK